MRAQNRFILAAAFLTFWNCQSASGQISMHDAVQIALDCHPQLKVARSEVAIAQARLIDAGKLENPVFGFSLTSQLTDGPEREGAVYMGLSQQFPVTAKLLRQRDLGVAEIKLACAEIREAERQFVGQIQEFYIEAVGAKAHIDVLRQLEEDADEYITLAKNQFQIAQGSELDVAAAETEKLLASQARELAQCDYRKALVGLKSLLGKKSHESLDLTQNLDGLTKALSRIVQLEVPEQIDRADIVAAKVRIEKACAQKSLARAARLEDWEIEGGFEDARTIDDPVGVERERSVNVGLKIPLPVRKKGQGKIAEAEAEKEKAVFEHAAAIAAARGEIAVNIEALCRSRETMNSINKLILPQIRQRQKNTREAYEQGLFGFNQVVLLRQQQTRTSEALVKAKEEYALGMAKLQQSLGTHPLLQSYDPAKCCLYKPGTEPKDAPFALPALRVGIQAVPVINQPQKRKNKIGLNGLFKNFRKTK